VILLWHVARRRAVPLLRCGNSSPGPKSSTESKVRCVPERSVFHPLSLQTLVPQTPFLQNSLSNLQTSPCRYYALIFRVSGSRLATMYRCRCNLWGVIQLGRFTRTRPKVRLADGRCGEIDAQLEVEVKNGQQRTDHEPLILPGEVDPLVLGWNFLTRVGTEIMSAVYKIRITARYRHNG